MGNKKKAEYIVSLIEKLLARAEKYKMFIGKEVWNIAQEIHRQAQDLVNSMPDE